MLDAMLNYFQNAGLLGLVALLVGLVLAVAALVMISTRATRARFVVFLGLALLPLAIGAAGAAVGHSVIDGVVASGGSYTPADIELGRATAAIPLEIGGVLTGLLLIVGLIGVSLAGDSRREGDAVPGP